MRKTTSSIIIFFFAAITLEGFAQSKTDVYLAANKGIFIAGEDLWFNAFVLDRQELVLSNIDRVLYLQLYREQGDSAVWSELYPIANGLAAGRVYLPLDLADGRYFLKAFTAHSFFADQPVFSAVAALQVVRDPRAIRSGWQLGDALTPKTGDSLQIGIFPEGGVLVEGVPNTVGFRVTDKRGLPVSVKGKLMSNGEPVLDIATTHGGRGSFVLDPKKGSGYTLQVGRQMIPLPDTESEGVSLHTSGHEDSLYIMLRSRRSESKKILCTIKSGGLVQANAAGWLKDSLLIRVATAGMATGIAELSLFDENLSPIAHRLVYIGQTRKLHVEVSGLKDRYGVRDSVNLKIRTTDGNGRPLPAALSIRVYDQLFEDKKNVRDIRNYYHLSTRLRESIYDPASYMADETKMDLLLLTTSKEAYNAGSNIHVDDRPVIADSLRGVVSSCIAPVSLMIFDHKTTNAQVAMTDNHGVFYLSPDHLSIAARIFVKYFSEKEHTVKIEDPFTMIQRVLKERRPALLWGEKSIVEALQPIDTGRIQYGKLLETVVVKGKGRSFDDRYLGYLDSMAKFEGNTDFVGQCGWLNCPACRGGSRPVEGVTYSELVEPRRSQVSNHPFSFGGADMRKLTYHYPHLTEEELLKKYKMIMTKGFYRSRLFESPDHSAGTDTGPDTRNALYWAPVIVTDANGEANIRFFCSDIRARFVGVVEGIGEDGTLGTSPFTFETP